MKPRIILAVFLLAAIPLAGCNTIKNAIRCCRVVITVDGQGNTKEELFCPPPPCPDCPPPGTCPNPPPPCRPTCGVGPTSAADERMVRVVNLIEDVVQRGAPITEFDECRDFCSNPDSPDCDTCRTSVGLTIMQPYINICQGTAIRPLPDQFQVTFGASTDIGVRTSPVYTLRKERGTIRWDQCGGESLDFVLPDEVRNWARSVADEGARKLYSTWVTRAGAGAGEGFFQLKEGYSLDDTSGSTDILAYGVGISTWAFDNLGRDPVIADGVRSPMMLPSGPAGFGGGLTYTGEGTFVLRP